MEVSHSKAGSSQISTISSIDWDEIDGAIAKEKKINLDGMVNAEMMMTHYNCGATKARSLLNQLIASDGWERCVDESTQKVYAKRV